MYVYVSLHVLVHVRVGMHECMHWLRMLKFHLSFISAYVHILYIQLCTYWSTHACPNTHIPKHTYTHTHIHPYAHTCTPLIYRSLFWIDTDDVDHPNQSLHPKTFASALDGSHANTIITTNLGRPLHITVDNPGANGRTYWTDSCYDRIGYATLHGGDRRVGVCTCTCMYVLHVHCICAYSITEGKGKDNMT